MPQSLKRSFWEHRWASHNYWDKELYTSMFLSFCLLLGGPDASWNTWWFFCIWPCVSLGEYWGQGNIAAKELLGGKCRCILVSPLPPIHLCQRLRHAVCDDSRLSGRDRAGLLSSRWKEKMPYVSSHLETPSLGPQREVCAALEGEKIDLRSELGNWPWSKQQGVARGTRHWVAWPIAFLLARGSVYLLSYSLLGERV